MMPIPPEIVLFILQHVLAIAKPNIPDRQFLLLTHHGTYTAVVEKVYSIAVLWSETTLDRFCYALESFQHLGPLVVNLWAGNERIKILDDRDRQNSG